MKEFKSISFDLRTFVEQLSESNPADVSYEDIVDVFGSLVHLFSGCQAQSDALIKLNPAQFSSTDAAVAIAALMEAQDLNTFDIGLWLAKTHSQR